MPRPCTIPIISLLAECEPWLIPHDCESYPVILAFYVPAHLSDAVSRLVLASSDEPDEGSRPGAGGSRLRVVS